MDTKLKRISYSIWAKTVAFLLTVITFAAAFSFLADMLVSTEGANELFARDYLSMPEVEGEIQDIYVYIEKLFVGKNEDYIINELGKSEYDKRIEEKLAKLTAAQNYLNTAEEIYYYVSDGENLFTNCHMTSPSEFRRFDLYYTMDGYHSDSAISFRADTNIPQGENMKVFIALEGNEQEKLETVYAHIATLVSLKNEEYIINEALKERNKQTQNNIQEFFMAQRFMSNLEGIYYYAADGENILTNCEMTSANEFKNFRHNNIIDGHFFDFKIGNKANISMSLSIDRKVFIAFDDDFIAEKQLKFEQTKAIQQEEVRKILMLFVISLLMLVYLIFVSGRDKDKNINMITIDRLWTELTLGSLIAVSLGFVFISSEIFLYLPSSYTELQPVVMIISAVLYAIGLLFLLSLVRHAKNRTFIKHSLIYIVCRRMGGIFKTIFNLTPLNIKIIGTVCATALFSFIATALFWESNGAVWFISLFIMLLGIIGMSYVFIKFVIKPYDDEVSARLKSALAKEVRAEGLKTELITNVSHDLKTPITAILNYSDLLIKEDANNEHARIIHEKAQKLRTLTEDLFEVSKAQSGNLNINKENLNVSELIEQTLAEFDGHSVLFRVNTKGTSILADSRLMGRVFENLVGNIIKYSLPGTRAYIDAFEKGGKTYITFKNIANYEMNFDIDEMTERFSRGDQSRGTDGNGLGLAIAQSYTEACGGNLTIHIDGDLFKVVIILDN